MRWNDMPIIGKCLVVIAVFGLFVVGGTLFTTSKMRAIDDSHSQLRDHQSLAGTMLARASSTMWGMRTAIAEMLIAKSEADRKEAAKGFDYGRATFIKLMGTAIQAAGPHAVEFEAWQQSILNLFDVKCSPAVSLASAGLEAEAGQIYLHECAPGFAKVRAVYVKLMEANLAEYKAVNDQATATTQSTIVSTWMIMLGGLVLVMGGGAWAIRQWISRPLDRLAGTMTRLAAGDFDVVVSGGDRRDEVGRMARVAEAFQTTGRQKIALETEAARSRERAEADRQQADSSRLEVARRQNAVVEDLAEALGRLAHGRLTTRIGRRFPAEYEKLRIDFNAALERLQDTMIVVEANASAIRLGTDEIAAASSELSRRTEHQASSLAQTAVTLDEITTTVRKTAHGCRDARQVVGEASEDARHSGEVVRRSVQAMAGIEEAAAEIGQIIALIDEIAFQTNLLSLNAGVEAARAGEAGRGFAVVATEVRALSQRSAEAAKKIKALIAASGAQVEQGVDLVRETGKALQRIVRRVGEIDVIVGDIAASAEEQASRLADVNRAVGEMDQATRHNAAMVEQSSLAHDRLARQTEDLARLMASFELSGAKASGSGAARYEAAPEPGAPKARGSRRASA